MNIANVSNIKADKPMFSRGPIGDEMSLNRDDVVDGVEKQETSDEAGTSTGVDGSTVYEDYESEGTERMQLNPSTEDGDDEYEDDDDDDSLYDDDDEDDIDMEDEEAEILPEAKGLVQPTDEEEDMGYDEDDERIALERPKVESAKMDGDFMNEEGSGSSRFSQKHHGGLRTSYLKTSNKKLLTESSNEGEVDLRESSGNFANDDEDDDNDDDDDDQNFEGDEESGAGFFSSNRKNSNHYFRKNTNDAIKIISTPLGKVGIVYQQSPTKDEKNTDNLDKKLTTLTDFDALSPDPESSHRLASSHPKITPVLTPDGKVALLYRGDSENSKYEPIRNLTQKFNNKSNESTDNKSNNKPSSSSSNDSKKTENQDSDSDSDSDVSYTDNDSDSEGRTDIPIDDTKLSAENGSQNPDAAPTKGGMFVVRPTDSVLPMINRPLSEVLGIKKNQFKQIRVKDTPTTTSTEATAHSLSGVPYDNSASTTLHFLTKVNLADYPTSSRTHNRDFDFSLDNTMLDERSRHRSLNTPQHNEATKDGFTENSVANTLANEELLSKTEVVNLAIIPHFDEDLQRLQRMQEHDSSRRHHRARYRHKQTEEDLSGIHCIMQAMMGIAAISTVFGMLGTFFKQRILDQLRLMHW